MSPVMTTAERVKRLLVKQLGVDTAEVTPEASIVDDLSADSLDTIEIVMACEEEFEIEIPDDAAEQVTTVADIVRYIDERIAVKK